MQKLSNLLGLPFIAWILIFLFGCGFVAPKKDLRNPNESGSSANADAAVDQGTDQAIDQATSKNQCPTASTNPMVNKEAAAADLITAKCSLCHGSGGQLPLLGTSVANASAKTKIIQSVSANLMPPGAPLAASEKKIIEDWGASPALNLFDASQPITYYNGIKDILDTRCAYCHTQASAVGKTHDPKLTTYQEVSSKIDDIAQEVASGSMPPSGRFTGTNVAYPDLSASEIQMIEDWKAVGSPKGVPYAFDASNAIVFETDIWPLIQSRCLACHSNGQMSPSLGDKTVVSSASATIASVVANDKMPPGVPLEAEEKKLIAAWADLMAKPDAAQNPDTPAPKPAVCP